MENHDTAKRRRNIYQLLENRRINEALTEVTELIDATAQHGMRNEVDQLKISYGFMLQYLAKGILDPQGDKVLQHIIDSLYLITDRCYIASQQDSSSKVFYTRRREMGSTALASIVARWSDNAHKHQLLTSLPAEQQNKPAITQLIKQCEQGETDMFNKIWSTFPTSHDDAQLLREMLVKDSTPEHVGCLVLSALFLGLVTFYDETKLALLTWAYCNCESPRMQVRALIYTVLALYLHSNRVTGSDAIKAGIEQMTTMPTFGKDMSTLQFLLARSRNTDNITRRVREDLMPGIMNMSPDLVRKIKDKDAPLDISDLEANPEWADMLEKSGVNEKMMEFNEMQLEGNDVYISAFSRLKSFPFFHTLSNWFLPYHPGHSVAIDTFGDKATEFGDLIAFAPLCNSDKYSFCLSMASIPESQRQLMFAQVSEQSNELKEQQRSELPSNERRRELIANGHLQDLYRFFKLFSRRREFELVFNLDMDFTGLPYLQEYTRKVETLSIIAEFYFKNGFHEDAIKYYNYMLACGETIDPVIYQKMGFAYQNLGNTREALRHYKRHLLACGDNMWTLKHIAGCYRTAGRHDKALEYYKQVDALQPQSVATTLNMGNCLLEMGNADEALQYYYKADFIDGVKNRALRPIAWCSFVTGNDERALTYYDRIIERDTPTAQDHMNRGHVLLCSGKIAQAIESYRESLRLDGNFGTWRDSFFKDADQLAKRGINKQQMALIADALHQ